MIMPDLIYCPTCLRIRDGNANNCDGCSVSITPGMPPSKYIKIQEEEKKMIVTICGSMKDAKAMLDCKKYFERFGHQVNCPLDEGRAEMPLVTQQGSWIEKIKEADLVVAIPKNLKMEGNGGSNLILNFGESTSYEIAIANSFNKNIMFW